MPHPSETAQQHPHKPAIIMGDTGEIVTYSELDTGSNQGAQLFRSLGIRPGDPICLMMENNRRFLEIVWAAQRSGLVFTPISPHMSQEEAIYILGNCGARVFIGSWTWAEHAEQILFDPGLVEHFFMVGGMRPGFLSWEEECAAQPDAPIDDECNGFPMLYSSGTTGTPKGIHIDNVEPDIHAPTVLTPFLGSKLEFDEGTVYLSPAPLYHSGPLHYTMMAQYLGGTVVLMEKFDAERALKLIEQHRVTHGQWVPIMFSRMLKLPAALRKSYDLSCLRVAIHAAAPCPVEVKEQMIDWWGKIFWECFSTSEGIGMTLINTQEWLTHKGSVGRAISGQIHIVGDNGDELAAGEMGLVYFSGDHIRFSYYREPEKTHEAFNGKGWATTGDIGYVDEEGYLYLIDRKGYSIASGSIVIHPQELENVLINHGRVADVAVFGVPNPDCGEEVRALVQPVHWRDANDEVAADILQWLAERIDREKMPRMVEFHPQLPRRETGKLHKQDLAYGRRVS